MGAMENALPGQLAQTIERVKGVGDAGYFEGDFRAPADDEVGGDAVSLNEERELAFEVRGRLVERANRLSEALVRVRSGDYGICELCGEAISAARLRAIPEVTTCVICQDTAERGRPRRCRASNAWRDVMSPAPESSPPGSFARSGSTRPRSRNSTGTRAPGIRSTASTRMDSTGSTGVPDRTRSRDGGRGRCRDDRGTRDVHQIHGARRRHAFRRRIHGPPVEPDRAPAAQAPAPARR